MERVVTRLPYRSQSAGGNNCFDDSVKRVGTLLKSSTGECLRRDHRSVIRMLRGRKTDCETPSSACSKLARTLSVVHSSGGLDAPCHPASPQKLFKDRCLRGSRGAMYQQNDTRTEQKSSDVLTCKMRGNSIESNTTSHALRPFTGSTLTGSTVKRPKNLDDSLDPSSGLQTHKLIRRTLERARSGRRGSASALAWHDVIESADTQEYVLRSAPVLREPRNRNGHTQTGHFERLTDVTGTQPAPSVQLPERVSTAHQKDLSICHRRDVHHEISAQAMYQRRLTLSSAKSSQRHKNLLLRRSLQDEAVRTCKFHADDLTKRIELEQSALQEAHGNLVGLKDAWMHVAHEIVSIRNALYHRTDAKCVPIVRDSELVRAQVKAKSWLRECSRSIEQQLRDFEPNNDIE